MKLYIKFLFIFTLHSCSVINQNDFIESKEIKKSSISYDLYQVGIDNYRYDFKLINNTETVQLFSAYLNDATYKGLTFTIENKKDITIIRSTKKLTSESVTIKNQTFTLQ